MCYGFLTEKLNGIGQGKIAGLCPPLRAPERVLLRGVLRRAGFAGTESYPFRDTKDGESVDTAGGGRVGDGYHHLQPTGQGSGGEKADREAGIATGPACEPAPADGRG